MSSAAPFSSDISLLTQVPPFFPLLGPPPPFEPLFVAVFTCLPNEPPRLSYIQRRFVGNGMSSDLLNRIAEYNTHPDFTVHVFFRALPRPTVDALLSSSDPSALRALLTSTFPHGPSLAGWDDTTDWRLADLQQRLLLGRLSALPLTVPGLDPADYALRLFAFHLADYVEGRHVRGRCGRRSP